VLIYRVRATLPTALIYLFICCKYDVDGDVFHDDTNYDAKNDHANIYIIMRYILMALRPNRSYPPEPDDILTFLRR
jgi:hypothetical protein